MNWPRTFGTYNTATQAERALMQQRGHRWEIVYEGEKWLLKLNKW